MQLKRLELYGFKTFPERTELEFGPGITAIVGPNGAGKSNLVDGILWALGEQSRKSLRSVRSQDVIFAGSDGRKPLGLAEVALTLDNTDGMLPMDFSEVTVTRRVFRSGEGEYQINRVPCRLRDIHELFLDTGIGKEAYSIITQSEIDAVLSLRSEDRRPLFEEAAGIQKYRVRKKEAVRKLDQTRQNLLRVGDVITELESQLGPMAEQAEKARRHQALTAELTALKRSLLIDQYQSLVAGIERSRQREEKLTQEVEQARSQLNLFSVEETKLRVELTEAEQKLEELHGLATRTTQEAEKAEGRVAVARERLDALRAQDAALEQEAAALEERIAELQSEIEQARSKCDQFLQRTEALRAELAQREVAATSAAQALVSAAAAVEQARSDYLDALDQVARARNAVLERQTALRNEEQRLARLQEELHTVTAQREAAEASSARAQSALEQARAQTEQAQQALANLEAQSLSAREEREQTLARQSDLESELAASRARHAAITEMMQTHEGSPPGVRAVLNAASSGQLSGRYQLVADLVNVPAELELAIEAALGPALDYIVTDTEDDARAAIAFLHSSGAGRATFLPQSLGAGFARPALPSPTGATSPTSLSTLDFGISTLDSLLGRVLLAPSLDAALEASRSPQGDWSKIVTLQGDVVFASGAITSGSTEPASPVLRRKRELEELQASIAEQETALAQLAEQAQSHDQRIADLDAAIEQARSHIVSTQAAQAKADRELALAREQVGRLDDRRQTLDAESALVGEEAARLQRELEQLSADAREKETRETELAAAVSQAEQALRQAQLDKDSTTEQTAAFRLNLADCEAELRAANAALARAERAQTDLTSQLEAKRQAKARLADHAASTQRQSADDEKLLADLVSARTRAETDLEGAKQARQRVLDAIAANLEQTRLERERLESLQTSLHRSQVRTAQLQTETGFAAQSLADDHRLTPEQALADRERPIARDEAKARVAELHTQLEELGLVNLGAVEEHERIQQRLEFLAGQRDDLEKACADLNQVIIEIEQTTREKFLETFNAVGREFQAIFTRLFGGGSTELVLCDPNDIMETGIEVNVTMPGKRPQSLLLLSGGERALTAVALLFALLRVKPSPFVVLDEIDAPLDEANVDRFCTLLREFAQTSQFILITHNKGTMETADVLYGVTMEQNGVSKLVSVRLAEQPSVS